ncbi:MAG: STAS/SEC14 domain-containing protein [Pseudomonadota bacterium]
MLTITKKADNRIDIELHGEIDSETMRKALDDLIAQTAEMTHGLVLYRIHEMSLPTLGALGVEMTYLPKLFGLLGKIDRCAVLSDAAWIRTSAEIEGAIIPGIEIKSFALGEDTAAEAWLAGD